MIHSTTKEAPMSIKFTKVVKVPVRVYEDNESLRETKYKAMAKQCWKLNPVQHT
jgi:hypothetical protein